MRREERKYSPNSSTPHIVLTNGSACVVSRQQCNLSRMPGLMPLSMHLRVGRCADGDPRT